MILAMTKPRLSLPLVLMILVILGEIYFAIDLKSDWATWGLENFPVLVLIPLLVYLQPRLRLTHLTLCFLAFHALILMVGGHYSYAKVPIGFWVRDVFELKRNNYDRFGHLLQGLVPAVALRELLIKTTVLRRGWFLSIVVISMCLAFSAFYEMIEWWAALVMGQDADAFLATQGDPWDTQWDMFSALIGASIGVFIIARFQDRALARQQRPIGIA